MEEITLNLEDIEKKILVYKKHLIVQQQINNTFKNNDDIEVIYKLLQENNSKINIYCEELSSIDKSIRELVRSNKNYSYNKEQILQSTEFINYHNKLKEVKTVIDNLDDFLLKNNIQVE